MKLRCQTSIAIPKGIVIAGCAATLFFCGNARAALTSIGPFTGSLSETWESFNNYNYPSFITYLPSVTTIMGGAATISNPFMAVYEPGAGATFGLSANGSAGVSDGTKGMGIDRAGQTATISFLNPIFDFGAYWGNASSTVSLGFSDGSSASFSYSRPGDGVLEWHGWNSTSGISSISYVGDYVVIDGLQAQAVVPEPATATVALLGLGVLALARCKART